MLVVVPARVLEEALVKSGEEWLVQGHDPLEERITVRWMNL